MNKSTVVVIHSCDQGKLTMPVSCQSRRAFLRSATLTAAGLTLGRTVGAVATPQDPVNDLDRPNVLFIAIDDLNDWTGCLGGHPQARTPNIDRLASQGILFTNAYCAAPACNPSRAALMTGVRPATSGCYVNANVWREVPALKKAVRLPQHFIRNGYRAVGCGKIYHGGQNDPESWDEYGQTDKRNSAGRRAPSPPMGPGQKGNFRFGAQDIRKEDMDDWRVTEWVIGQINKKHEKPFFIGCGIFRPHLPWFAPKEYFDQYPLDEIILPTVKTDDLDDVPKIGQKLAARSGDHQRITSEKAWRQAVQAYLACITFADDCVGHVMEALEKSPHRDNTIIVLWSDHGWHLGEKLHWRKFALWEEATHNVLAFVAPGRIQAGLRCERPVNLLDIYPTLVDMCGLPEPAGGQLEGYSLTPLMRDPKAEWEPPSLTTYGKDNHTLRSQNWRYIRYEDGTEELYDHRSDPMEWTNLAGDSQFDAVKKDLARWLPEKNAELGPTH